MIHHPNVGVLPCFPWIRYSLLFSPSRALLSFSPHCHGSHSMFVHLKVNALLGAEILFQENKRTEKQSFTEVKVNYIYKKGLTKICLFASSVVLQPKTFFVAVLTICWKKLYALKALTSTVKRFNGLSAHFGVTDFFKTTDFSGREKHCNVRTQCSQRSR